jgi:tRNA G10  N-methylase Trm11
LNNDNHQQTYIYTYASPPEELSLCHLELRAFFGSAMESTEYPILNSPIRISPSRSPFIRERIDIIYSGDSVSELADQVSALHLGDSTFKLIGVKTNDREPDRKIQYSEQRAIEREVGSRMEGAVDVHKPNRIFGIVTLGGRWHFGEYHKNPSVWLQHVRKPRGYSMALPTRVARAVVNIAIPDPHGIKAIDPCCGIGTVLVEALSMGIDIVGRDINPQIASGARENLFHYGLRGRITLGAIDAITEHYDVAIIDMPYNLVSKISSEEQQALLLHARRVANRVVIISIEDIDTMITNAGFTIIDTGAAHKGSFSRRIALCL